MLELGEQGCERLQDAFMIFDFVVEIAHPPVTLAAHKTRAWIGAAPQQSIEIREHLRTEAPRESGARQAHEFTERSYAHGREARALFLGPAQCSQWQRFESRGQHRDIGDETARAGTRRRQRGQRGGCEREMRRGAHLAEQRIGTTGIAQATAQFAQPAEEVDAGLDLEQQPIGRLDGHLRRECGRDACQPLHEFQLTYGIAWTRIDAGHGRERGTQGHPDGTAAARASGSASMTRCRFSDPR